MRTHKVSILALLVGLGVGVSFAQTQPKSSDADVAILIDVLRAKQAQLQAADPAYQRAMQKREAKAARKARAKAISEQRALARQEAQGASIAPAASDPAAEKLVQALRQKQAELIKAKYANDPLLGAVHTKQAELKKPATALLASGSRQQTNPAEVDVTLAALRAKQSELIRSANTSNDPLIIALRAKQTALTKPVSTLPNSADADAALVALRTKQAELAKPLPPQSPAERERVLAALRQAQKDVVVQQAAQKAELAAKKKAEAEAKQFAIEQAAYIKAQVGSGKKITDVPAPSSKEIKLAKLLQRYQNDEITPHQYHAARAQIVAEP